MGIFNQQSPKPKGEQNPHKSPPPSNRDNENKNEEITSNNTADGSSQSNPKEDFGGGFEDKFGGGFGDVTEDESQSGVDIPNHLDSEFDEAPEELDSPINIHDTVEVNITMANAYTYEPNRSYFFIFGPRSTGKSVLLMSLYRYLKTQRNGDSIRNINRPTVAHEQRGNKLINEFDSNINKKVFPTGTVGVDVLGLPAHLNFKFIPRKVLNKPAFEFCLMDMAGEDLARIDFQNTKSFPESIRTYIEDLPQRNLRFIYIIDPSGKNANKTSQIQLFNAFMNLIDNNKHSNTPILLLISKWDTVSSQYSSVQDYIQEEYPEIWREITDETRNFDYGKYSIGTVVSDNSFKEIDFTYPKKLFNWIYNQHTGENLDPEINSSSPTKQSWWDKLIDNLFN